MNWPAWLLPIPSFTGTARMVRKANVMPSGPKSSERDRKRALERYHRRKAK